MEKKIISKKERGYYNRNGYLLIKNFVPKRTIRRFMNFVRHIIELELRQKKIRYDPAKVLHAELISLKRKSWMASSWIYQTINTSHALQKFLFTSGLDVPAMELLSIKNPHNLGIVSPAFRFDVPGDTKNIRTWHQDSNYFLETKSGKDALVVWVPLNQANSKNGSVIICPKSHTMGRLTAHYTKSKNGKSEQFTIPQKYISAYKKVTMNARPGDVVFINMDTIHKSGLNISNTVRYTVQLRFSNISNPEYRPVFLKYEYPDYKRNKI